MSSSAKGFLFEWFRLTTTSFFPVQAKTVPQSGPCLTAKMGRNPASLSFSPKSPNPRGLHSTLLHHLELIES